MRPGDQWVRIYEYRTLLHFYEYQAITRVGRFFSCIYYCIPTESGEAIERIREESINGKTSPYSQKSKSIGGSKT